MKNILFSTTRQWNVGDEFILFGAVDLVSEACGCEINPIIYNRHPDLRSEGIRCSVLRDIKLESYEPQRVPLEANFKVGLYDNSFKSTTDGGFIDYVVFAGTPEWSNGRCFELFETIEKYNLPAIAIGVGNLIQDKCELVMRNLDRFRLFTVRSPQFIAPLSKYISPSPIYLPCPSICSAPRGKSRAVKKVKKIGLIYSCDKSRSVMNNLVSTETYNFILSFYRKLMEGYPEYA